MRPNFGRHLTIGVEEELFLLDARTLEPAPAVAQVLGGDGFKTELFACVVETNTPVCESAEEAAHELTRLRRELGRVAARHGLAVAGSGTHPFAAPEEQEIVQEPRYLKMLDELGPGARRQLVCGLHVHVGMESFETCLRTLAAILPWLPSVLALSLNSPYLGGVETGALSSRAAVLLELPRGGPPPRMATSEEWQAQIDATGKDYTRSWWDVRPHPRLGTLEVRIADQPTATERAAALVALLQALCKAAPEGEEIERADYLERRAAAARGDAPTAELLAVVEPAARALGTWELVAPLTRPAEALRQLEVRDDGLEAVAADLVERTAA